MIDLTMYDLELWSWVPSEHKWCPVFESTPHDGSGWHVEMYGITAETLADAIATLMTYPLPAGHAPPAGVMVMQSDRGDCFDL